MRRRTLPCLLLAASFLPAADFRSAWPASASRPWAGAEYWANPLQDWRLHNGRLENVQPGGDRNVYLLTREIAARAGTLDLRVRLGRLNPAEEPGPGYAGFRIGIRGAFHDYRDSALRGEGVNAALASDGRLFIGELPADAPRVPPPFDDLELRLAAAPEAEAYRVTLSAWKQGREAARVSRAVPAAWLPGGLAVVSSSGKVPVTPVPPELLEGFQERRNTQRGGNNRYWFRDWSVSGTKLDAFDNRAWGPILFTLHTLSRRVLKFTAQLAPLDDGQPVTLEIASPLGPWKKVGTVTPDPLSRTATFRVPDWDDSRNTAYRVSYAGHFSGGTIRRDPKAKPQIVVAAFTGNNDLGFPHADIVGNIRHHAPDLLFFTGDNIYERVGDYGIQRAPLATATLDYLRKWYLFGWEYAEILRDIPSVCLPDDHDVYHGNIWGAGGRRAPGDTQAAQDEGGYSMPADWVNMVQRTQTAHLPDPYDPTPVEQGITVYYSHLVYGGLSTAILEDRKWKSSPRALLPKFDLVNGWAQNPAYDAVRDGDVAGAVLLGPRQEKFLADWAQDWSGGIWMKTVVSQTLFADLATLPAGTTQDNVTPKLRIMQPGEYPAGEVAVADHDSNGWPQTPRQRALRLMRQALAFHINGDTHLGNSVQYGIDQWNDAGWSLCVPAVANVWPRRWYPSTPGRNRRPGAPPYTGEFLDGFGNRITVHAVANPVATGRQPAMLYDRSTGYGIASFDRARRTITFADWPRAVDASQPGAQPYPGWPITIRQTDNGLPRAGWQLGLFTAPAGFRDPVVQVIDQASNEPVYTFRIQGELFDPPVRGPGLYTVKMMDPARGPAPGPAAREPAAREKVWRDVEARRADSKP